MSHWQKLGLPIALGFCAAYLNWQSINRTLAPRDYVAAAGDVKAGEMFGKDSFKRVSVSHTESVDLQSTLIPWSEGNLAALRDRFAQRQIYKDSLLTRFDVYDTNIAKKGPNELSLPAYQEDKPSFFVNDLVSVLNVDRRPIDGWRVLSIAPVKNGFKIELAIGKETLRVLETSGKIDVNKLEIR